MKFLTLIYAHLYNRKVSWDSSFGAFIFCTSVDFLYFNIALLDPGLRLHPPPQNQIKQIMIHELQSCPINYMAESSLNLVFKSNYSISETPCSRAMKRIMTISLASRWTRYMDHCPCRPPSTDVLNHIQFLPVSSQSTSCLRLSSVSLKNTTQHVQTSSAQLHSPLQPWSVLRDWLKITSGPHYPTHWTHFYLLQQKVQQPSCCTLHSAIWTSGRETACGSFSSIMATGHAGQHRTCSTAQDSITHHCALHSRTRRPSSESSAGKEF